MPLQIKTNQIMAQVLSITPVARNGYPYTLALAPSVAGSIIHIRAATADEIAAFPTALTAIVCRDIQYGQETKVTYLSATATATVITAANA